MFLFLSVRPSYQCPSMFCETPMVHHIRRFVHGQGCVQIVLKELDSPVPGYQHTILTYSWCRLCKQVRMWTSESLLFQFSILVVTFLYGKAAFLRKCSCLELWLNWQLTCYWYICSHVTYKFLFWNWGRSRWKILCEVVLLESVKTDSERTDLSRKNEIAYLEVKSMVPFLQWIFMSIWERADTKTCWHNNWLKPLSVLWSPVDWTAYIASVWCLDFFSSHYKVTSSLEKY